MSKTLEELKAEATSLGMSFRANIGAETLEKNIEAFYRQREEAVTQEMQEEEQARGESGDTEGPKIRTAQEQLDRKYTAKQEFRLFAKAQEAEAKKTVIVTIIDNDQRVNNSTTTCVANCSNQYFDLGTAIIPLNEKVEVRKGHVQVLSEVRIPRHAKSTKDPLISELVLVPRYSIQYDSKEA